jgi:hypothetical protein
MKRSLLLAAALLACIGAIALCTHLGDEKPSASGPALPVQPLYFTPRGASIGGVVAPNGKTEIQCDLPEKLHTKNCGGSDGSGLCVFTSIMHSARYQHVPVLEDFQDWMKKKPGGGWPDKVKKMITQISKERGVAEPPYLQVEGKDIEILKTACAGGRMPSVTYSHSPTGRYGGGRIAHMVSLPHADDTYFAVLDNNYIGAKNYEWMSPQEFMSTYAQGGSGWSVILLDPGPPNPPRNR